MPDDVKYCHVGVHDTKSFLFDHVHIVWNEQITLHQSPAWELSYILKGSGTRIVGDNVETFSSGEVVLLPPNLTHGWYFDEFDHDEGGKIENITIIFTQTFLDRCIDAFPETENYLLHINTINKAVSFVGDTLNQLQAIMTDMLQQNDMLQLASLLGILSVIASSGEARVVGSYSKPGKGISRIQEASRFMVHNYQRKITLDDVARYVGMSRSSFCSLFKRERGKPFFSALNEYRIDCSCLMLRETSIPIADICFAVGFEDIPHYNRTFKRLKGETPKDYRAKHQQLA
ncbi:MAG: AraC family transcriptional regulator [Breznakibacter sp.]